MSAYPLLPAAFVGVGVLVSLAVGCGGAFDVLAVIGTGTWAVAAGGWAVTRAALWARWQWRQAAWNWRHGRRLPPGTGTAARLAAEAAVTGAARHAGGRHEALLADVAASAAVMALARRGRWRR